MNYKKTINLPRTDFPMRARLPEREPELLKRWKEIDIYKKILEKRKGKKTFILHDGPPYSNGHIHLGQALNKVLKDITVKFHALSGYYTPFTPGWDNHGMPIENKVLEEIGRNNPPEKVRKACREFAAKWIEIQKQDFIRLGVFADWDNPYLTMKGEYEGGELEIFADIVEKGYVYRGFMPVHWCPTCETALALSEIEYKDIPSPSLYFTMDGEDFNAFVWTTTPWTIISNLALALHPEAEYVVAETDRGTLLMAKGVVERIKEEMGWERFEIKDSFVGKELEGKKFKHPFYNRESPVILADFVTMEEGTGIVHIAPGHGREDYEVGTKYGLDVYSPVDEQGRFTDQAPEFKGLTTDEASKKVVEILKENGHLVKIDEIVHAYPHCWRCHNPLIFRATEQWFLSVDHDALREKALENIHDVKWHPPETINRIYSSVQERPDWCLSRQRLWGVNIPAFYCKNCGKPLLSPEIIRHVGKLFKENNSDIWFKLPEKELLPEGTSCPHCGGTEFEKETDVLDVWFDSGVTSLLVLGDDWPADVYLEGPDQHRGWFNSSLMIGMIQKEKPPYRAVITHGWVLDEEGRSMHKSLGNVIHPEDVVRKHGADVLRLWVASTDYTQDVRIGEEILQRLIDSYRKIRNTFRFMLGNLYDFTEELAVPEEELFPQDRYILLKWRKLLGEVVEDYKGFYYHRVYRKIYNFIVVELSSFYLDILKDRLYTWGKNSHGRRAAQTVIYRILKELLVLFSPVLTFTTEEAYLNLPGKKEESVFLEDIPECNPLSEDEENFLREFEEILLIREEMQKVMEEARRADLIGNSLEARLIVDGNRELLEKYSLYLPEIFIVSQVEIGDVGDGEFTLKGQYGSYRIVKASGQKCERCWVFSESVGKNEEHPTLCEKCVTVIKEGDFEDN